MTSPGVRRKAACAAHGRVDAVAACAGCGLFVCAACAGAQAEPARCARCRGAGHPIPWEDPALGVASGYTRTLRAMLGESFFATAPWTGGLGPPIRFAMLSATIGALGSFVWGVATAGATSALVSAVGPRLGRLLEASGVHGARGLDGSTLGAQLGALWLRLEVALVALAPLDAALQVVVLSALTLGVCRLLGGKGTYESTVRALGYASGAAVLHVLPLVGGTLVPLAYFILAVVGLRRAHGLPVGRAIVAGAWWVPAAAILVVAMALLTLGAVVRGT